MFTHVKDHLRSLRRLARKWRPSVKRLSAEVDALYGLLYAVVHDPEQSPNLTAVQTAAAFARQWSELPQGQYLLSDPWFRDNVDRILWEEEVQIKPEWFRGKRVLDAGCGNGRWSYGLARLGAEVTVVDVNPVAVRATEEALREFGGPRASYVGPLEELSALLPPEPFDLVLSWGVLHHCRSFTRALAEVCRFVKPEGLLYVYLYGRESLPYEADLALFKDRVRYNTLADEGQRYAFLLARAGGDPDRVHNVHDIYAPLINRRLEWPAVERLLRGHGFEDVVRTIDHTELLVRAIRGGARDYYRDWILPRKRSPYWFTHHERAK